MAQQKSFKTKVKEEAIRCSSESQTKGAVRDKIRVLSDIGSLFSDSSIVEEGFNKNSIKCSFAAEGCTFTLGFTCMDNSKSMTLLRGKKLDTSKAGPMELVIRKRRGTTKFDEIIVGDVDALRKYSDRIKELMAEDLTELLIDNHEVEESKLNSNETKKQVVEQIKYDLLVELVNQGNISIEIAAEKLRLTAEQFTEKMNERV